MAQPNITIRPAQATDIPAVRSIQIWYVLNSVITFQLEPFSEDAFVEKFHYLREKNLPYIVAEEDGTGIVGFVTCAPYRFEGAYFPTAEIGLYCHHEHRRKGIGHKLIRKLLDVLGDPEKHLEYFSDPMARVESPIRQLLAYMAVDETGPKQGMGLKEFYERFGFKDTGLLTAVGYKFDRWVDTMRMQYSFW